MIYNRKYIFEAPTLPGGLIFIQTVPHIVSDGTPDMDAAAVRAILADHPMLRFKGAEPTARAPHPLRFAPERFDFAWLLDEVRRARGFYTGEVAAMKRYLAGDRIAERMGNPSGPGNSTCGYPQNAGQP